MKILKQAQSGICVRYNGGDTFYVSDIEFMVDSKNVRISTFGMDLRHAPRMKMFHETKIADSGDFRLVRGT